MKSGDRLLVGLTVKKGNIILCKQSSKIVEGIVGSFNLHKGTKYYIQDIFVEPYDDDCDVVTAQVTTLDKKLVYYLFIDSDMELSHTNWDFYYDYFYSEKELRKLKLEAIDEKG